MKVEQILILLLKKNSYMNSSVISTKTLNVVLISLYDLGHQPLPIASAAALLQDMKCDVTIIDLVNFQSDDTPIINADLILLSVPMHTAARMAVNLLPELKTINPSAHFSVFGLYALHLQDALDDKLIDSAMSGEFESNLKILIMDLKKLKSNLKNISGWEEPKINFDRQKFLTPSRDQLPSLEKYAKIIFEDKEKITGYVETSHGCAHVCPHCPVTAVYKGKFRIVDVNSILLDVDNLVSNGAEHITFGDPDFFNAPKHSFKVASLIKQKYPHLTFDAIIKVEHILEYEPLLKDLHAVDFLFITSAFESMNEVVLQKLQKGHTAHDMQKAIDVCREASLLIKPTWIPFTPWMQLDDYSRMLNFIISNKIINMTSSVQFAIRLLIPKFSTLLQQIADDGINTHYSKLKLTHEWEHTDRRVESLFGKISLLVDQCNGDDFFTKLCQLVEKNTGQKILKFEPNDSYAIGSSEEWYCCAEPTEDQMILTDSLF